MDDRRELDQIHGRLQRIDAKIDILLERTSAIEPRMRAVERRSLGNSVRIGGLENRLVAVMVLLLGAGGVDKFLLS